MSEQGGDRGDALSEIAALTVERSLGRIGGAALGWAVHGGSWCAILAAGAVHVLRLARCVDPRLERQSCGGGRHPCELALRWERAT